MAQLLDVFGFLSVVLRGLTLAFQSLAVGGLVFGLLVVPQAASDELSSLCRRMVLWASLALAVTQLSYVAANSAILMGTTGLRIGEVAGAGFFVAGSVTAALSLVIATLQFSGSRAASCLSVLLASGLIGASVATSHATARVDGRFALSAMTGLHQLATGCWVGGFPYLLIALARSRDPNSACAVAGRFSRLAQFSVVVLLSTGLGMSFQYMDSPAAFVGTAYGAMLSTKIVMFGLLLVLGAFNFFLVRRFRAGDPAGLPRLRRFAEAEAGIGLTVILAAGSLTSQPPAVDLAASRVPVGVVLERMAPVWPRMTAPPLSEVYATGVPASTTSIQDGFGSFVPGQLASELTPSEIALSEFNHHWAGLFVFVAGLLALAARAGVGWARHWPLAFLGLGIFIFFMADADYWPLGRIPFWKGFMVSEVLQHRLVLPLVVAFAVFEWKVQTGRSVPAQAALVFPLTCAIGGAVLLTHSHSLNNLKEELLAELSHIPIALLGVTAGWSRWLEVRLPDGPRKAMAWVWPVCFALIGAWLLNYRES